MRIGFVLLTFAFLFARDARAQESPPPARIPVVKTWEDLHALTAIDLGGGVKIRVGIEADRIPQWSGALLYCLTEGYTPASSGGGETPFGPVHAMVHFGEDKSPKEQMRWGRQKKEWPKGSYLYVCVVAADRVGNYHVQVTHHDGKVLALTTYEGKKDFFHPWMPWLDGLQQPKTPREGIALPAMHDMELAFIEEGKKKKGKLPTYLPPDDKPGLTIKMEGKELVIRAETEFTVSRPDYHFLARWWVNDKPFVPKQIDRFWDHIGYGLVSQDKELRLKTDFHPERLGAKPGDKIGLQLMHTESEWAWCSGPTLHKFSGSCRRDGEHIRISNRIDFIAPKKE